MGTIGNIFPHLGTVSLLRKDLTPGPRSHKIGACTEQDTAAST